MRLVLSAILSLTLLSPAWAADHLTPQVQGEVSYVSGGIGEEERETLRGIAGDFNLKLTLASQQEGSYVGGVKVNVRKIQGPVLLEAVSEGPWFYAKLPPGRYQVSATYQEKSQQKTISIGPRGSSDLRFYWP